MHRVELARSQARPSGPAHITTSQGTANSPTIGTNAPAGSQRPIGERINALRQQLANAIAVNRAAQAQVPIAMALHNDAIDTANAANAANVANGNIEQFAQLLKTCNLRAAELLSVEGRAVETFSEAARIQAEITALINYRPPAPPAPTSQRSDRQDDKTAKEHQAMIEVLMDLALTSTLLLLPC